MFSSGNTIGPLLPQVPARMWAGWVVAGCRPVASRRMVNVAPAVVTVAVPATLLPLSGVSFAVRTVGGGVTGAGEEVTGAGEVVTGVGDAAATGAACATALAPTAGWPPQAVSAAGTMMVNTNRFCIRNVLANTSLRRGAE